MGFRDSLKHVWTAFIGENNQEPMARYDYGPGVTFRDRPRMNIASDKTIITGMYNRLAIDVSSVDMVHVQLDDFGRFKSRMVSGLNNCLTVEANIDQGARAFRQAAARALFNEGVIAIVPVDTDNDIRITESFDIRTLRVGSVTQFFPEHVQVNVWNVQRQQRELVVLPKRTVAIVENPFYDVMNEPNSILQRLIRKLALLDAIDEQSGSGKLDIIIQLPYVIKSETRRAQAQQRRTEMEEQLQNSRYGVAYAESTEKITQLNRPAENNMMKQVEYLTTMLYGQLGLTEAVFNGTADEAEMLSYHNRTIEPILVALTEAMKRSFLTKTARTQKQSIEFYRNPFRGVPAGDFAEMTDKFSRNAIMTGNEIRGYLGLPPSDDPDADKLKNPNLPEEQPPAVEASKPPAPSLGELLPASDGRTSN